MIPQKGLEKQQGYNSWCHNPVGIRQPSFLILSINQSFKLETMIVSAGNGHSIQIKTTILADFSQATCRYFGITTEKETRLWNYILFDTTDRMEWRGTFSGINGDSCYQAHSSAWPKKAPSLLFLLMQFCDLPRTVHTAQIISINWDNF